MSCRVRWTSLGTTSWGERALSRHVHACGTAIWLRLGSCFPGELACRVVTPPTAPPANAPTAPLSTLTSRATHAHPTSPRSTGFCAIFDCISSSSSSGPQPGVVQVHNPASWRCVPRCVTAWAKAWWPESPAGPQPGVVAMSSSARVGVGEGLVACSSINFGRSGATGQLSGIWLGLWGSASGVAAQSASMLIKRCAT